MGGGEGEEYRAESDLRPTGEGGRRGVVHLRRLETGCVRGGRGEALSLFREKIKDQRKTGVKRKRSNMFLFLRKVTKESRKKSKGNQDLPMGEGNKGRLVWV